MRIATWNVNGIRAAARKGMMAHIDRNSPDVLLMQEVRALPEQLDPTIRDPDGWSCLWHPAEKKGYSGTAIWSRADLKESARGISDAGDPEGRVLVARV